MLIAEVFCTFQPCFFMRLLLLKAVSYRSVFLDYILYDNNLIMTAIFSISACLQIGTGGIYEGTNSMDTHRFL